MGDCLGSLQGAASFFLFHFSQVEMTGTGHPTEPGSNPGAPPVSHLQTCSCQASSLGKYLTFDHVNTAPPSDCSNKRLHHSKHDQSQLETIGSRSVSERFFSAIVFFFGDGVRESAVFSGPSFVLPHSSQCTTVFRVKRTRKRLHHAENGQASKGSMVC